MDSHVAPYGAYVDLGVPYLAVLLVSYLAPVDKAPKSFPEDYPKVGDTITALVRHYGDPILPGDVGKIALTQDPHSIGTATTR